TELLSQRPKAMGLQVRGAGQEPVAARHCVSEEAVRGASPKHGDRPLSRQSPVPPCHQRGTGLPSGSKQDLDVAVMDLMWRSNGDLTRPGDAYPLAGCQVMVQAATAATADPVEVRG